MNATRWQETLFYVVVGLVGCVVLFFTAVLVSRWLEWLLETLL